MADYEKGEFDEEYAEEYEETTGEISEDYTESKCFQCWTRACGRCCWLTLVWCLIAWAVHSIVLSAPDPCFLEVLDAQKNNRPVECSQEDIDNGRAHWDLAPAFSKTLMWMSLAHHTEPWQEHWDRSAPPPPPNFER